MKYNSCLSFSVVSELISADRTGWFSAKPFFDAFRVENVVAKQLFYYVSVSELHQADCALVLAMLFHPVPLILDGIKLLLVHAFRLLFLLIVPFVVIAGGEGVGRLGVEGSLLGGWVEVVCELVVVWMGVNVDVDEIGEVLEDIGHSCKLIALLEELYFIISSWLFIVLDTRFKKVLDYCGTKWALRLDGLFLCLK
jgi:hypothetical protein